MRQIRLKNLPESIRREIKRARLERGLSQLDLGKKIGLAQANISSIENGKITPRYDTLIEILRVLDLDLVLVPRELLSAVQAIIRDYRNREAHADVGERPLYAVDDPGGADDDQQQELGDE